MSFPQYRYSTESLPHRDFELDATYESVVQHNPFLFRVFDDDSLERTRLLYRNPSSDIYEECASTDHRPQDIVASRFAKAPPPSAAMPPYTDDLFLDVFSQLMWKFLPAPTDRCFISASFSLAWAVHEADRRRNTGRQHVRIAVINACAVPHAELATYLLQEAQRHHYPHPYSIKSQWSHSSQEVLIYAHIPAKAILRIVRWSKCVSMIPDWFFQRPLEDAAGVGDRPKPITELHSLTNRRCVLQRRKLFSISPPAKNRRPVILDLGRTILPAKSRYGNKRVVYNDRCDVFLLARKEVATHQAVMQAVRLAGVLLRTECAFRDKSTEEQRIFDELAFYIYWWPLPMERRRDPQAVIEDRKTICDAVSRQFCLVKEPDDPDSSSKHEDMKFQGDDKAVEGHATVNDGVTSPETDLKPIAEQVKGFQVLSEDSTTYVQESEELSMELSQLGV